MDEPPAFSDRHGFTPTDSGITIRREAPDWLRALAIRSAYDAELPPSDVREILCGVLLESPDANNWSEYPNIDKEVRELLNHAQWFHVYDFIEAVCGHLNSPSYMPRTLSKTCAFDRFVQSFNTAFRRKGVGWQLVDGKIEIRGEESFEASVRAAITVTRETGRSVAARELHEALHELSKRPAHDITGAIQHAMAALECTARDITGNPKPTLGELTKKCPGLFPTPLDQVVEKLWGFTSEQGRHLREGRAPNAAEAELVVGLAGTLVTYLVRKANLEANEAH